MANLQIIRELCNNQKMTIRELAHKIGRDESTIQSAIRRGSTNTVTLEALATALKVHPGVFFEGYSLSDSSRMQLEIDHLREIIKEKERMIALLMDERDKAKKN